MIRHIATTAPVTLLAGGAASSDDPVAAWSYNKNRDGYSIGINAHPCENEELQTAVMSFSWLLTNKLPYRLESFSCKTPKS